MAAVQELEPNNIPRILEDLKVEYLLARQRLNKAHDIFIQCIPPQIIAKIFVEDATNHLDDHHRPLTLASVSRAWRSAIFSVPEIWTTMRISYYRPCWEFPLDLVEQWLARSDALPLRIEVSWITPLEYDHRLPLQRTAPLLQLIQRESYRLEALQLEVPPVVVAMLKLDETPLLRTFSITVCQFNPEWPDMNYGALTELTMTDGLSTLEIFQLLRICPNLIRCTLCVDQYGWQPSPEELPLTPIGLPQLQFLRLKLQVEHSQHLPDSIYLPKLRQLILDTLIPGFDPLPYAAMIRRSGCALRSFTYNNKYMPGDDLRGITALLKAMPSVQDLNILVGTAGSITGPYDLYALLLRRVVLIDAELGATDSAPEIRLPKLRRLVYSGPIPFTWTQFADLCELHAQQRTIPSLALMIFFVARFDSWIDEDTKLRLDALPLKTRKAIHIQRGDILAPSSRTH